MIDVIEALKIVWLSIFLATSSYWIIVSVSRIYRFKKYRRGAAKNLSTQEESGNVLDEQWCYHYETEIHKYVYFLLINLTEVYGVVMDIIYNLTYINFSKIDNSLELMPSNFSSVDNLTSNELCLKQSTITSVLGAFQNVADLFVVMLGVSLMSYLTRRIKKTNYPQNKLKIWAPFILALFISLIIIGTSAIPNLFLITRIIFPISLLIYFCIFLRSANQFGRTLLQRAGERLAQFGSNKEEYQQYKYFKYTMRIICFGYLLIVVSTYLFRFQEFLTSILFHPKCYFPFNFLPHNNPIVLTADSIGTLLQIRSPGWRGGACGNIN